MTCFKTLSLLDDYIDNEVNPQDAELIRSHLECCPSCKAEHEKSLQLKGLLKELPVSPPPPEYWEEVSSIIKARTVDSIPIIRDEESYLENERKHRTVIVRSAVVFAASLALLITSLLLSNHFIQKPITARDSSPTPIVTSLGSYGNQNARSLLTQQEMMQIASGNAAIGAPSMVNRYSGIVGIWTGR